MNWNKTVNKKQEDAPTEEKPVVAKKKIGRPRSETPYVVESFTVSERVYDELERQRKFCHVSKSSIVKEAIRQYMFGTSDEEETKKANIRKKLAMISQIVEL